MDHDSYYARQIVPQYSSSAPKRTHSGSIRNPQNSVHQASAVPQPPNQITIEAPIPKAPSPTPFLSGGPITSEILDHIDGLKHLNDRDILELLKFARYYDRSSIVSTQTSMSGRSSSSVRSSSIPSLYSDPRSSIASSLSSYSILEQGTAARVAATRGTPSLAASRTPASQTPKNSQPHTHFCTFCQKGLTSKTYWKHHEEEHHEQARKWLCPDCDRSFFAEKRFLTHHVKDHGCKQCAKSKVCPNKAETVVHRKVAWGCGFCFEVLNSWESRCDHIAKHFEEDKKAISEWKFSTVILSLLLQPAINSTWELFVSQKHPSSRPSFSWDKREAATLRKKLEQYGNMTHHIQELVQQTYELAHQSSPELSVHDDPSSVPDTTLSSTLDHNEADPQSAITEEYTPTVFTPDPTMDTTAFVHSIDHTVPPSFFIDEMTPISQDPHLMTFTHPGDYMNYLSAGQEYRSSIARTISATSQRRTSTSPDVRMTMTEPISRPGSAQEKPLPPDPPAEAHHALGLITGSIRPRSPRPQQIPLVDGWRDGSLYIGNP